MHHNFARLSAIGVGKVILSLLECSVFMALDGDIRSGSVRIGNTTGPTVTISFCIGFETMLAMCTNVLWMLFVDKIVSIADVKVYLAGKTHCIQIIHLVEILICSRSL